MNKSTLSCIVLLSLILSACASKTYEWVKINPNKIAMAQTSVPYTDKVRYVNVQVNARHKTENITYVENSSDYFDNPIVENKEPRRITSNRTTKRKKLNSSNDRPKIARAIPKPIVRKAPKEQVQDSDISMSKLNSSLILPKKKKVQEIKNNSENSQKPPIKSAPVQTEEIVEVAKPENNIGNNKEEAPGYDNGLKQLEELDQEISKNKLEPVEEQQVLQENQIKEEGSKRNSYMWVGLVLLIVGLIIGLIFGGMAYLISVVGIVFLLIGYFTKI